MVGSIDTLISCENVSRAKMCAPVDGVLGARPRCFHRAVRDEAAANAILRFVDQYFSVSINVQALHVRQSNWSTYCVKNNVITRCLLPSLQSALARCGVVVLTMAM